MSGVTEQFIRDGPLFSKAGLDTQPFVMETWLALGVKLAKHLGDEATNARIYQYYLPVYFWLLSLLKAPNRKRALVVGLSCPQGGGKTTLTVALSALFSSQNVSCVVASLDDFYLTRAEQQALADKHTGNPLLLYRGNAGTHDLNLCCETLECLKVVGRDLPMPPSSSSRRDSLSSSMMVRVPRFDKAAFGGLGDRVHPPLLWPSVCGRVDLVLLEGWCLGFKAVPEESLISSDILQVNEYLRQYDRLWALMDAWMLIEIDNVEWVYEWREEAEQKLRKEGRGGMSEDQIRDFVNRFMPAYRQYLRALYTSPPLNSPDQPVLHIHIDKNRRPV